MYEYKTTPFRHQKDLFEATKDLKSYGLFWEQGCGKTKPTIDTMSYLWEKGDVELTVVIAPNGVHRNWANDEIPDHMPDRVRTKTKVLVVTSSKWTNKSAIQERKDFVKYKGLKVVCLSFSACRLEHVKAWLKRIMANFRAMVVVDESQHIKTSQTKTTAAVVSFANYAEYRRILSGTPITQGPFDVYPQLEFLDGEFWKDRNLFPKSVFKNHFGVYVTQGDMAAEGFQQDRPMLVDYQNLEELKEYLKVICHRLTKESAGIDLPPKLYTKRYFDLTPHQRRFYDELYAESLAFLPDLETLEESDEMVVTEEIIVKLLRLQQVTAGYIAVAAEEPERPVDGKFPRLDLLMETLEGTGEKAIIWSRFTKDIDMIMDALADHKPVRYDGQVTDDERERAKNEFQKGDARYFVGKPQSGATGLTLHAAKSVHYYTNSYNYGHRAQSEDRAHRIGLKHPVLYVDYIANRTVDEDIIRNLRKKLKQAQYLLDDAPREGL
jgi:SNF2 family DNA or RNA helicase